MSPDGTEVNQLPTWIGVIFISTSLNPPLDRELGPGEIALTVKVLGGGLGGKRSNYQDKNTHALS